MYELSSSFSQIVNKKMHERGSAGFIPNFTDSVGHGGAIAMGCTIFFWGRRTDAGLDTVVLCHFCARHLTVDFNRHHSQAYIRRLVWSARRSQQWIDATSGWAEGAAGERAVRGN